MGRRVCGEVCPLTVGSSANASCFIMYLVEWRPIYAAYIILVGFIVTGLVNAMLPGGPSGGVAAFGLVLTLVLALVAAVYQPRVERRRQEERIQQEQQQEEERRRPLGGRAGHVRRRQPML